MSYTDIVCPIDRDDVDISLLIDELISQLLELERSVSNEFDVVIAAAENA